MLEWWRSVVVLRGRRALRGSCPVAAVFRGMECRHETRRASAGQAPSVARRSESVRSRASSRRRWRRRSRAGAAGLRRSPVPRARFGLPNLRRNVCPHFYMTGSRGAIPIQAPHLLKALIRQDANVSRCQLRGGVHLEQGYVNDVCLTPRFNQCVFYEDDLTRE